MYVYSEHGTAGEPGAVAEDSGCWGVGRGLQGARSTFSWLGVGCASRHEGSKNGLCLPSIGEFVDIIVRSRRLVRDCQAAFQEVLIFATKPKFTERATQSEHQLCRAGERGPR